MREGSGQALLPIANVQDEFAELVANVAQQLGLSHASALEDEEDHRGFSRCIFKTKCAV